MVNTVLKYLSIIFFLIGFIYNKLMLLGLSVFIIILLFIMKWWIHTGKKQLKVKVSGREKAGYKGNILKVTYTVENYSLLPFLNLRMLISLHRNIEVKYIPVNKNEGYYNNYELIFSVPPKSKVSQTITFQINQRGNYFFGDTQLTVSDPFSLNINTLDFIQQKEISIYPDLHSVPAFHQQQFLQNSDGRRKSRVQWMEERILPKGAREYSSSDPFYKIDWKQTSKTGQLFTKQFEHSMKQEVWILGNLRTTDKLYLWSDNKKVEQVISTVASLAYFFSKTGVSYNIMFNAKLVKVSELYHLNANKKNDLKKVLYELAKLGSYTTVDFGHTFRSIKKSGSLNPIIIVVSSYLSEQLEQVISSYRKQKSRVIWINPFHEKTEGSINESLDILDNTGS